MRSVRFRTCAFVCLAMAACLAPRAWAQGLGPAGHDGMLTQARVSTLADGRLVVSMTAAGDLPGLMTLTLDPDGAGRYTGQWAHTVAFLQDLNADGTVSTEADDHDGHELMLHEPVLHEQHHEYTRAVRRGTLSGAVVAATVRKDDSGHITGVDFAQLTVTRGSLTFQGAAGTGFLTAVVSSGAVIGNSFSLTF